MAKKSIPKRVDSNHPEEKRSYKTIIIVLIIAAILIPVTVYAVMYITEIRSKAYPTEKPQKVEITNVTDSSVTISWITQTELTIGFVKYSSTSSLTNTALDIRDKNKANGEFYNHYVEVTNLSSSSSYNYTIVVGGKEYKKENGEYYEFETGPTLQTVPTPLPIKGKVEDPSRGNEEVIIYMYLENDNDVSNKLSVITDGKVYTLDLANFRTINLNNTFTNLDGAILYILAQGADRGEGSITTEIAESSS